MEQLSALFRRLLNQTDTSFLRYIYADIQWNSRMIGLTGPRGVGKTTLLLQHIRLKLDPAITLYVNAEDFYFADNSLLSLADTFEKYGGKYLFIDEIHKYEHWSRDLKLIYDYHPDLHIVFTGSSVLDIQKGAADLSRRAVMYHMQGLSFREYLQLFQQLSVNVYTLEDIIQHKVSIPELKHPLPYFQDYLKRGYYPFSREDSYEIRLKQVINQTVESDIPFYAGMNVATARKLKQLLAIIARSVPFKPNMTTIAEALAASRNNIADYCLYLEQAGMIAQLRDGTGGVRGLGMVNKIYLDNTNLLFTLAEEQSNSGNIRETFFFNQVRVKYPICSSAVADFQVGSYIFEVGGKSKGLRQIKSNPLGYVVKDDVEFSHLNFLPLWQFGFLY